MMFEDRKDAGERLAEALHVYKDKDALVLAIPKGGIEVGYQVAKALNADFSIIITRKLPYPDNPEAGFGAIAEDGSSFIFEFAAYELLPDVIERIIQEQKQEIARRIQVLRQSRPLPEIADNVVIVVDDGIAMGSTMRASIKLCKKQKAKKIIVAVPVAGPRVAKELTGMVDDLVVIEIPPFFRAVAQVYKDWYDVSDQEAIEFLEKWNNEHLATEPQRHRGRR
jgi:predicted phosphoribosyltransferase